MKAKKGRGKSALGIVQKYHPKVRRVKDAKKPISIVVRAADCKSGRRGSPNSCAMARAFERQCDGAIISVSKAYLINGEIATRYQVPPSISREIVAFDRSRKFSPGIYALSAISKNNRLGPRKFPQPKSGRSAPHDHEKRRHHKTTGIRSL